MRPTPWPLCERRTANSWRAQCHLSPTHLQTGRKDATVPDASSSSIRLPRRSGRLGLYLNPYTDAAWDQGEFSLT